MPTLVKQRNRYYLQFYDLERRPQRKRVALLTTDKRTARAKQRELESDFILGLYDPWTDDPFNYKETQVRAEPVTIQEAQARFIDERKAAGRSATTVRTYGHILGLFSRRVGTGVLVCNVSPTMIHGFIRDRKVAPSTHYTRYRHLKAFFSWAKKSSLVRRDPMEDVVAPESTHRLPKAMDEFDLEAICTAIRKDYEDKLPKGEARQGEMVWMIPMLRFAFYTGMRASELARLRWRDVDEARGLIYIWQQKNGREQSIPLTRKAAKVLSTVRRRAPEDYVFAAPGSKTRDRSVQSFVWYVSAAFRQARKDAGITRPISFHSLRHGFCTALASAGKNASVIQKAARHASIQMTSRYIDLANEQLKHELEDVFGE